MRLLSVSLILSYLDFSYSIFNLGQGCGCCRALTRPTPALGGPFLAPQKTKQNEIQPAGMCTHSYYLTQWGSCFDLCTQSPVAAILCSTCHCVQHSQKGWGWAASEAKPTNPSARLRLRTCSATSTHRIALPAHLPAATSFIHGVGWTVPHMKGCPDQRKTLNVRPTFHGDKVWCALYTTFQVHYSKITRDNSEY